VYVYHHSCLSEEAQVLNIDSNSSNNPQTITNACNEYFFSLVQKEHVNDDDNGNDNTSNRVNNIYTIPINDYLVRTNINLNSCYCH
jgi:hypothetical protein